jgi:hypothetical protein
VFGQHKWPEPAGMTVEFFRDFYRLDSSHVRTRDFEKRTEVYDKYKMLNRFGCRLSGATIFC